MNITFWGAAKQVTGSMYLLTLDSGYTILVDCGLNYEKGVDLQSNEKFPFEPSSVQLLLLTHAHIDHSGNIPTLIKRGFKGQILCTEPTLALAENLLKDSVNVQMAESRSRRKKSGKSRDIKALYGQFDVEKTIERMVTVTFNKTFQVNEEVKVTFYPAGHILGAASILIEAGKGDKLKRIGFTGDLGKKGAKLVVDSQAMPDLDYLICESTYGDRKHQNTGKAEDELYKYVKACCIDSPGRLVIPAFSVGRTQAILFVLNQLYQKGLLGNIKVFTDSPLGILSTKIHNEFDDYLNEEAKSFLKKHKALFEFPSLSIVKSEADQKAMSYHGGPSIIVSSAGMIEGGRIQQHVRNNIQNPLGIILIAGYCATGTLGHRLLHGSGSVTINHKEQPVYAKIRATDIFSAHPDKDGLLNYLEESKLKASAKVFLVHGEEKGLLAFAHFLKEKIKNPIIIPEIGSKFEI